MKKREDMNAVLKDLRNKGGFRVPDGYFERLPDRVMQKIREEEGGVPVVSLRRKRIVSLAAAAAVALLLVAGYLLLEGRNSTYGPDEPARNVTAYLISSGMDEQVLYDFLTEEESIPETFPVAQDDDQIIDYLVNEGVNESLLAELY